MTFFRLLPVAMALSVAPLQAQSIEITSAPSYGSPGSITGAVTGVDFATHSVAVYIQIEGAGWWTKPSNANPTVPIQPDGTFTASIYTCCLDDRATLVHAALLGPGITPPIANGTCRIPAILQSVASDTFERYGRTLEFAGRTWAVKESPTGVGPGGNPFTDHPDDVFVDPQGRLHLRVVQRGGQWMSSEVILLDDIGYGTYWFTTESQVGDLDANLTFAAFTWDSFCDDPAIPAAPNREIDFEDSRWGNPADPFNAQVVVQPYQVPGNVIRYTIPTLAPFPTLTRYFTWRADRIDFAVATGRHAPCSMPAANVLHASTYVQDTSIGRIVPTDGRETFRFNLWIHNGGAPSDGQTAEVIVSDFRYSDRIGVFPAGCGRNPAGSAVVLNGDALLGNSVTLGVDNPTGSQSAGSLAFLLVGFAPPAGYPCGFLAPGFGMSGALGEFLFDLNVPHIALPGGAWSGPGSPVPFQITIPPDPALVGNAVYPQGVIVDVGGAVEVGLTDGFEICVRV